jgi:2-hydroxycyclohexanecarboxyl-CoA dehydrogenase
MAKLTFAMVGRVALVTGAGQGVGAEIARTLAAHGAHVAVNDFVIDRAETVVQDIQQAGGRALAVQADVSDFSQVKMMAERIEHELGPPAVLVNNAGNAGPDEPMPRLDFWNTKPTEWDRYLRVNLHGVMVCTNVFIRQMIASRWGRVLTIISDAGRTGEQGHEAYSAAKAGAAGFSRSLARSAGQYGVTANTISLGNIGRPDAESSTQSEASISRMLKHYIIRRQGRPIDVAAVALLLTSDAGEWITGQNFPVNGGFSLAL